MPPLYQPGDNTLEFSREQLNLRPLERDASQANNGIYVIASLFCFGLGIYLAVTTSFMVIYGWAAVPYWDQWDELILSRKQLFSSWLYSQHNEHRILFPRLLFAIDTFAFSETNRFNFFCNVALPSALAGLIVFVAHRHISRRISDTLWIAGIVLALLFSAMQFENFIWGFQVQFFGVELAAVASIACLVLGRGSWMSLTASIGFSRRSRSTRSPAAFQCHFSRSLWPSGRNALGSKLRYWQSQPSRCWRLIFMGTSRRLNTPLPFSRYFDRAWFTT